MKAAAFTEFGGPEVLRVLALPEPHAGLGPVGTAAVQLAN